MGTVWPGVLFDQFIIILEAVWLLARLAGCSLFGHHKPESESNYSQQLTMNGPLSHMQRSRHRKGSQAMSLRVGSWKVEDKGDI